MKDKQIEEMAKVIKSSLDGLGRGSFNFTGEEISAMFAETLYNAGYRKQKDGEWIKVMNHRECSECHYRAPYKKIKAGYHLQDLTRLCPNCGAKMKGAENEKI